METKYPIYGFYCVMLTCSDLNGQRYRHPVAWFPTYLEADDLLNMFMIDYYRGKMHKPDDYPVIVDFTCMRRQKLPKEYNHVVVEGDLSSL